MSLIQIIKDNKLKDAIKSFDKKEDLLKEVETFIENKYNEKKNIKILNESLKDFKEKIEDYIITQFDNSKDIYGLFFLYDMFREMILNLIIVDLDQDFKGRKMETTEQTEQILSQKINEFKQNSIKNI